MSEYKPFRFGAPSGKPDLVMTCEDWEKQEQARRAKLGPEVAAAEARTAEEYRREQNVEAPPTRMGGRFEVDTWRQNLRAEAALDAQGLPDSSPENPAIATPGNRLPGRVSRR